LREGSHHCEADVNSFWKRVDFGWIWWWLAIYGGSLSVLALYLTTTFATAAARVFSEGA
jgi:hypothetical protein